jgi:hypothetical protein
MTIRNLKERIRDLRRGFEKSGGEYKESEERGYEIAKR